MSIIFTQDCDENMFWSDCGLPFGCNPSCLNPDGAEACGGVCEIGCFCNDGYIFSDETYSECIFPEECILPGNECMIEGEIGFLDCELCCWDTSILSWLGDSYCDEFGGCAWEGPQFNCPELSYDCGDCNDSWDGNDLLGLCSDSLCIPSYDVNDDNALDILDVIIVVNLILGLDEISCSIDYDDDGEVNVLDLVSMVNLILN